MITNANLSWLSLFEQQVRERADAIAVTLDNKSISYRMLDMRAKGMSQALIALGAGPDELVGVLMNRTIEMVVALIAVGKSGAAYVPLDPCYPDERIDYIINDSKLSVLIVDDREPKDKYDDIKVLCSSELLDAPERQEPQLLEGKDSLAYVIYTSGSTGKPKGVEIPHRAYYNLLQSFTEQLKLGDADRLLAMTTLSFDISGLELFLPLSTGGCVVLASTQTVLQPDVFKRALQNMQITVIQATPSAWRIIINNDCLGENPIKILCGGEALAQDLAGHLLTTGNDVWNLYGPTETTIWSTAGQLAASDVFVNIGKPIAKTTLALSNFEGPSEFNGRQGELLIGGEGVARGYRNRSALTASRFVPDEQSESGERCFKTGDNASLNEDGTWKVFGRLDNQVKINGFRVELGEIEHVIREHPDVYDACVILSDDAKGGKRLIAYFQLHVSNPKGLSLRKESTSKYREFVQGRLPEYMVPSQYIVLDRMPLTDNGKVNRLALPPPDDFDFARSSIGVGYAEPVTSVEKKLVKIWQKVLEVEPIGVDDKFWFLGGDSLCGVEVWNEAQKQGLFFLMKDFNTHQSIRELSWRTQDTSTFKRKIKKTIKHALDQTRNDVQTVFYQKRGRWRDNKTEREEYPYLLKFKEFYGQLENKEKIFYLCFPSKLLHWVMKALEYVPASVNIVMVGTHLDKSELVWIKQNLNYPFFHIDMKIDTNSLWRFLFNINEKHFGWLDIDCFVFNPMLFSELSEIEDGVAMNGVWSHSHHHLKFLLTHFLFFNIDAIRTVEESGLEVSPGEYSYLGEKRKYHASAYARVPSRKEIALLSRYQPELTRNPKMLRQLSRLKIWPMYMYQVALDYLGFELKKVRNLTRHTIMNMSNYYSDDVMHMGSISYYDTLFRKDDIHYSMRLTADALLLQCMRSDLPDIYRIRRHYVMNSMAELGFDLENQQKMIYQYVLDRGVSETRLQDERFAWLNRFDLVGA